MMYKSDEHGEYKVTDKFIDAWRGNGHTYVAGFCVCEIRDYGSGILRVHREPAKYLHELAPVYSSLHNTYMTSGAALLVITPSNAI